MKPLHHKSYLVSMGIVYVVSLLWTSFTLHETNFKFCLLRELDKNATFPAKAQIERGGFGGELPKGST